MIGLNWRVLYKNKWGNAQIRQEDDTIATVYDDDPGDETGLRNAEFIVRACNAHDDLVMALKSSNEWLKLLMDSLSVDPSTCIEITIDGVKHKSTLQKCLNRSIEALKKSVQVQS